MPQPPEVAPVHVSMVHEFPEDLYEAMRAFVRSHPSWDQYRLMQVALAGFLFQQGSRERAVARHYLNGLFDRTVAGPQPDATVVMGPPPARGHEVGAPVAAVVGPEHTAHVPRRS